MSVTAFVPEVDPAPPGLISNKSNRLIQKIKNDDRFSPRLSKMQPIPAVSEFLNKLGVKNADEDRPVAMPLSMSIKNSTYKPTKKLTARKFIGVDDDNVAEYYFHNHIHSFGNTGFFGGIHALLAPISTYIIDNVAYDGVDIRKEIAQKLAKTVVTARARVVDMCCGVGMSTRALQSSFADAELICGIDTSPEFINMAKFCSKVSDMTLKMKNLVVGTQPIYARGNAERTILPKHSFDLVTIMYGFHEIPHLARYRILKEARRLLKHDGYLAVIDISPDYTPSKTMLAGEPYVQEYQKNIMKQMQKVTGFSERSFEQVVPGHVGVWLLKRDLKPKKSTKERTGLVRRRAFRGY